ncbi:MAG: S-adenosylmethionine decarboxylase [Alphaproteobacteria bacterium]|jgi:S-adenosylmethionine/arginine decarboxylase-like enzyme|nr:S-adenosylmethionine decarboxylase [Alphaproteobacteria bacterium]MBT4084165.1 S-adenosylmethionine decarboxylase [Alphaproteobacteria bacterium]MBT4545806.1 S-adenosylmethionine decarboxylase [Alphaproteobacteria bacterium]MBT7747724.1 S-adenosylmethionine decarboxylase [Alphaproteobacteria bacterium]
MEFDAMAWGQHLILDMADCNRSAITDADKIRCFSADLVEKIGMIAFGEPVIEHFATDTPEAAGYSLVQLIETSNITAHFAELTGDVYLDVFSCKPFDEGTVLDVCELHFQPRHTSRVSLQRDARKGTKTGDLVAA